MSKKLAYPLHFSIGSILFLVIHNFSNISGFETLFYAGICNLLLSAAILFGASLTLNKYTQFSISLPHLSLMTVLLLSVNLLIYTHIPITADRSLSVFLMQTMDKNPKPFSHNELEKILYQEYILKKQAVLKRMKEQAEIGNIEIQNGNYILTKKGRRTLHQLETISKIYGVQ